MIGLSAAVIMTATTSNAMISRTKYKNHSDSTVTVTRKSVCDEIVNCCILLVCHFQERLQLLHAIFMWPDDRQV